MSFLAKLFLDNTERAVLNANILIRQATDWIGRPNNQPQGGLINIRIKSTHEHLFWEWMVSPTMMKNGYIRFYKHDGMSKFADLEFWDCYCVDYYERYDANSNEALDMHLTLSPGVSRFKNVVFEKNWKVTDLSRISANPTTRHLSSQQESDEQKIIEQYFTDESGRRVSSYKQGDKIILVLETQNMTGEKIDINLNNKAVDFLHNGEMLENDNLTDYEIKDDVENIKLEVISEDYKEY